MRMIETIKRDLKKQIDTCNREQTKLEELRNEYAEAMRELTKDVLNERI